MKLKKIMYSIPLVTALFTVSNATSLKDVVDFTIKNNQDINSKLLNNKAFRYYIDEQKAGYYPKLDLTASLEKIKEKEKSTSIDTNETRNGNNIQLDLEQLIYDGNLTLSKISESEYNFMSNKYKNANDIENIVLDGVDAYLSMVKFQERIAISKDNINIHNDYLEIAQNTEEINGTVLDKVQTKAKIHNSKNRLFEEINNYDSAKSSFDKNVGMKVLSEICRPGMDESKIPFFLNDLKAIVLSSNLEIKEQIEKIKEQKEKLSQGNSNFLPTLKFKLQAIHDDDLITSDTETKRYTGKVELRYNIFNGFSDNKRTKREKLFLRESRKKLDVVTKDITDRLTNQFNTYQSSKKQITELTQFIKENKQIIGIYKDQFDSGTRSFIDVLNVESDLYNSKMSLINTEFNMYKSYYNILQLKSSLYNTISLSTNQVCDADEFLKDENLNTSKNEADSMEKDLGLDDSVDNINITEIASLKTEYALFLRSYNSINIAQTKLNNTENDLLNNQKIKVVSNTNGTHTLAVYNIESRDNAIALKNKLNNKYPGSYFIKKSNR